MEILRMSTKERARLKVIEALEQGWIGRKEAALKLGISERQITRLRQCYKQNRDQGLIKKQRAQAPRTYDLSKKEEILDLVRQLYFDFGPTFAAEKLLTEHQKVVSVSTLRKWMIAENLHTHKKRRVRKEHPLRERRAALGELIQVDGSYHAWFEERAPKCTLLVFIDDATSRLLHLQLVTSESHLSYTNALHAYLQAHGRPEALYTDKHAVFSVNHKNEDGSAEGVTAFQKSLEELGIEAILAHSPQAKGRVERVNRTLQSRLVKELRLRKISSLEQGNKYLEQYMLEHNKRFAVEPLSQENRHTALSAQQKERLELILSHKARRTVSKNLVVQFQREYYQLILPTPGHRIKKSGVFVCRNRHNELLIMDFQGQCLEYKRIAKPLPAPKICDAKAIEALRTEPKPAPQRTLEQKKRALRSSVFRDYSQSFQKKNAI